MLDLLDEVVRLYDVEAFMTCSVSRDQLKSVVSKGRILKNVARLGDDLDVSNKRGG